MEYVCGLNGHVTQQHGDMLNWKILNIRLALNCKKIRMLLLIYFLLQVDGYYSLNKYNAFFKEKTKSFNWI